VTLSSLATGAAAVAAGLSMVMAGAWATQRATGASGWIDAIWTFGVGAAGAGFALFIGGVPWRAGVVAALCAAWALRLGGHIAHRTRVGGDDPRYAKLMRDWGPAAPLRMFGFLQAQAAVGAVLALSVGLAAAPSGAARWQDGLGLLVALVALVGEAVADAQIARFKADPAHRGRICDVGLWSRSRHPNYFFEWLFWVSVAIAALGHDPLSWLALAAPAVMYWTLRYASGVPPLEQHMLATRGAAFRAYQDRTPVFFPRLRA
jgi:steroid 5-alpha reductase family enzyme